MNIKGKIDKLNRWINIWKTQFVMKKLPNRRAKLHNNKVLVIKLDAIGDFIIWLDSAKEFRNLYKDKHLVLLCSGACKSIGEATGYFDEIITLDIRRFEGDNSYRQDMLESFRDREYEVLIQTAYSRTIHMDLLAAGISANKKIAFVADESRSNLSRYIAFSSNKKACDKIYDMLIEPGEQWLMEVNRNAMLIRGLGMRDFKSSMPVLLPQKVNEDIMISDSYCVIFPGASTPKKMWNIKNYAKIADYISESYGLTCVVCGANNESYLYEEMKKYSSATTKLINYCGKTTLIELAEIIRRSKLTVSNDTSGIHFAQAVGCASVCILGEYNYGRFLPYECDDKDASNNMIICNANMPCKRCAGGKISKACNSCMATTGRYLCVEKVDTDMVMTAIDRLLG